MPKQFDAAESALLVERLRTTISRTTDVDAVVRSFGQVDICVRRERGELIPLLDHARGMILALLSANRPWRPIADNIDRLDDVFGGYRPEFLEATDPALLEAAVRALKCGNTRIKFQMQAIRPNLATMRQIVGQFGSLDAFVERAPPEIIARHLSRNGSPYRLKELGQALAMEYLKNVCIRAVKPDLHILRICGPERLGILQGGEEPAVAAATVRAFAESAGIHPVQFDNLIWLLGATEYAEVCTAVPRCDRCDLQPMCRFSASEPGRYAAG